jgi:plastocyanin
VLLAPGASAIPAPPYAQNWTVQVGEESANDAIQGMAFLPGTIWINQGDTVHWAVRSGEIHTVTFLPQGHDLPLFNPGDPTQLFPQGGSSYDGVSYYNSGILTDATDSGFPSSTSYSLTFDKTGDFTYYCLVHGVMMKGIVHVRAEDTPYPFTEKQYAGQAAQQRAAILADGSRLWHATIGMATNHKVFAGADDGVAMVMRFIQPTVRVHVGQSVTFVNNGMAAPHTVTFGVEQPNVFAPYGDPTNYSGGPLNSGLFLPGSTFTVTFTHTGDYDFFCALHDYMGMAGTVLVVP